MRGRNKRGAAHEAPRKADLRTLRQPGTYLGVEDKAALQLACAIHRAEAPDSPLSASWSAQERAEAFYNANGLAATLDEIVRLGGSLGGEVECDGEEGAT